MKRWVILLLGFIIVFGHGQRPPTITLPPLPPIPTPEATGALSWFIAKLKPCFEIRDWKPYPDCTIPAGRYCLYYSEDPEWTGTQAYHTFGWYSEKVGCGALYPIVRGQTYDRCTQDPIPGVDPAKVLPCLTPGWGVWFPPPFERIGFWLNNPYSPKGAHIYTGGHYFTCTPRNWDGLQHAYIYEATFVLKEVCEAPTTTLVRCWCDCNCTLPKTGKMYLIFWEDWCKGGDWD